MKPDRCDRRAIKELKTLWQLNEPRLAMLFREEHKAVVRLVNSARRFTHNTDRGMELNKNGAWVFIDDLLVALAERAK